MKLHILKENRNNHGPTPTISYKFDLTIGNTPEDKSDSIKVGIKTQPGDRERKMVVIYVPMFRTGSPEALLSFVTILHNIIQVQDLSTGPHRVGMTKNLVVREVLRVFYQKN